MAIVNLITIKNWFKTGLKPTQSQFWDTWDSFRHKNDKVPVAEIEGINELLAQVSSVTIYKRGQLCIFKNPGNESDNNFLEPGDTVIGFVEGDFLNSATYYGGDPMLLSSYEEPLEEVYYNFELIYSNPYSSDAVVLTRYNPSAEDFKTFSASERTVVNESEFSINLSTALSSGSYDTYVKLERYDGAEWSTEYETTEAYSAFLSSMIYFNDSQKIRFTIEIREAQYPV